MKTEIWKIRHAGKAFFLACYVLSLFLTVALFSGNVIAEGQGVKIRVGEHEKYSRVSFDWGKNIGYQAYRNGDILDIVFKAKTESINTGSFEAKRLSGLQAVKQVQSPLDMTHIRFALPAGVKHRHYRVGNSIVFDLYSVDALKKSALAERRKTQGAKPRAISRVDFPKHLTNMRPAKPQRLTGNVPAEPKKGPEATKVAELEKQKTAELLKEIERTVAEEVDRELAVEAKKAPKPRDMPKPSFTASVSEAPDAAAVKVASVEQEQLLSHYTTVTLSTIEPATLAVFERFGDLWIVADSKFASIAPKIAGPLADDLGPPQRAAAKGGVAYRLHMPRKAEIAKVQNVNLSWIIALREKQGVLENIKGGQVRRVIEPGQKPSAELFLPGAAKIIKLKNDKTGEDLHVMTSRRSGAKVSMIARYPQFLVLPAHQGALLKPYDDNLLLGLRKNYITIQSEPRGLTMSEDIAELPLANVTDPDGTHPDDKQAQDANRLFDFHGWRKGGRKYLFTNQRAIENKLMETQKGQESAAVFLEMALLYFANGYGHETIGALRAASLENPELLSNPGFLAIKGGAEALAGFSHEALRDLSSNELKHHPEARLWAAYAAASSEQWRLAGQLFPKSNRIAASYPSDLSVPFMLYMAESALRLGDTVRARRLMDSIENFVPKMGENHKAAMDYLRGEAYRQEGEVIRALRAWYPVVNGRDRLFHAKASLATVKLLRKIKRITDDDALDRLETLRYAWRGDGLEIQILRTIANLHLEKKRYIPGLREMRRAVDLAENLMYDSSALVRDMSHVYKDLYVQGQADELPPFEAVAIYNSFKELMPAGYDSLIAEQNYTEYLVEMDLLEEAGKILEKQLKEDLEKPQEISEVGARLASIYLQDNKARRALAAIQKTGRKGITQDLQEKRELLRARALSELGLRNQAIETLKKFSSPDAAKLTADIYWKAQDWKRAAKALNDILPRPFDISSGASPEGAKLVLNAAVAYKLAGDREAVKKLRDTYMSAMKKTDEGTAFVIVTRDKQGLPSLKDRQTVLELASEVDIFKSFLDDYKMDKRF